MRLGLIGWYGHSNYGDERILYCITKFFSDYDFFVTSGWSDARIKINELNQCDYILIGGGGLILRNIGNFTDFIDDLKKPFGFIGISVEAKHKSMESFFEIIKQKADFILVRDKQSKEYLNNHSKVIVGPDLTFLYPFDIVNEIKDDVCGFNIRDWHYWKSILHGSYHKLMRKLDSKLPQLDKIYPFASWDPNNAVKIVKRNFKNVLPIPFYFESNAPNDTDVLSKYFKNVPSQFDINDYTKIRYLIGMRYHSIVFATQCGIPFVSLSYQPKNDTFCFDMDLSILSVDIYKINELEDKIDYIKNNHQQIRERLLSYRDKSFQDINYILQSILGLVKK